MQTGRQFSELTHQHRNKFIILLTISFLPWKQASNSQDACSSRSYLGLAELKDERTVMQKPDLSWKTGRNKDYQVYSLESRSYFSLHLGTETWNSWVEGLFVIHRHTSFYTFLILNVWIYYYLFSQFNTLENELKSSPTDTTSVGLFFVLPASAPFSHLLASYWQQPWGSAGPGHSPAGGKRPLQPDTRPWHYQAAAPGLSGCILSPVHSLLVPSEGDRLMAAKGREREEDLVTRCPIAQHKEAPNAGCYQQHSLTQQMHLHVHRVPDIMLAAGDTAVDTSFTYLTAYFTICQMPIACWAGQKVCLGFSVTCYGRTRSFWPTQYLAWVRPSYKSW